MHPLPQQLAAVMAKTETEAIEDGVKVLALTLARLAGATSGGSDKSEL